MGSGCGAVVKSDKTTTPVVTGMWKLVGQAKGNLATRRGTKKNQQLYMWLNKGTDGEIRLATTGRKTLNSKGHPCDMLRYKYYKASCKNAKKQGTLDAKKKKWCNAKRPNWCVQKVGKKCECFDVCAAIPPAASSPTGPRKKKRWICGETCQGLAKLFKCECADGKRTFDKDKVSYAATKKNVNFGVTCKGHLRL